MKLNLGCGFRKKEGHINVDSSEACMPDLRLDLAKEAWPWEDNSVQEVRCEFSLDQMGTSPSDLRFVMQEMYRVCKSEAKIFIVGFHPRHDQFFLNPMCVHRLAPDFFHLLSIQRNLNQIASGSSDDCLGLMWEVNFDVTRFKYLLYLDFQKAHEAGELSEQDLRHKMRFENNVCHGYEVDLHVIKN